MFESTPHRRYNPLMDEWILVSPQRTQRPWQGQVEESPPDILPDYDPHCYLCPGNQRAGGARNDDYPETFVFDNDYPALLPYLVGEETPNNHHPLFQSQAERGICRVICFTPRHDLTLAKMKEDEIRRVVRIWGDQTQDLMKRDWLHYVQIFENRGAMMGASNPHPHGQLWATEHIPVLVDREHMTQLNYFRGNNHTLLLAVAAEEIRRDQRIIWQDDYWLVLVPYWAVWPFETLLIPMRPVAYIHDLSDPEQQSLAKALSAITIRYDNLFKTDFPYSMGIHQAPVNSGDVGHWHLHIHFYPPLLRSATVRKFMVGYELMASAQRDITAEQAAQRLRELPSKRFR